MKPRLLGVHTLNAAPKTKDTGRVAGFLVQTSSRRRRPRRPRERRPAEISKGKRGGEIVGRSFLKFYQVNEEKGENALKKGGKAAKVTKKTDVRQLLVEEAVLIQQ